LGTTRLPRSLFRCSSSRSSVCLSAVLLYLRSWFASSKSRRNPHPKPEGRRLTTNDGACQGRHDRTNDTRGAAMKTRIIQSDQSDESDPHAVQGSQA
jgi:hypothetical protein